MKMIVTIVEDMDVEKVLTALDETLVPQVMKVIADLAAPRYSFVPSAHAGYTPLTGFAEVQVGGFLTYVLDIDHFEQV